MQATVLRHLSPRWQTYFIMLLNQMGMDIRARYLGTMLGVLWAILVPLLWTLIFAIVIVFVFRARLNVNSSPLDYVLFILCGMAPWMAFQESLINASNSIVANSNIVKNVPFPLEILPFSGLMTGLVGLAVNLVLVLCALVISGRALSVSLLFLPVAVAIQTLFALGWAFFLASLTVFVRDVSTSLTYLLMIILYLSPVVYDVSMMPDFLRGAAQYNPVTQLIEMYRAVLYHDRLPDFAGVAYLIVFSAIVAILGVQFFRRTKPFFADFLA
ncbi:MAG: ABC transporter permease [Chloroflexi bacterium]|nr:ABC transporter permease [Chloroflexota bacterium]